MKKVVLTRGVMKLHYKAPQRVIVKATDIANAFLAGGIQARKLNNGKYSVLNVDTNNRILIDKDSQMHLMEHQQYNKLIDRR